MTARVPDKTMPQTVHTVNHTGTGKWTASAVIGPFVTRARKSVLVQNAAWLFAGQGLSFVVQAFYFIVLARLLGTTQYGLLAGAIALVGIASRSEERRVGKEC